MKSLFARTFASLLLGVLTLGHLAQAQQAQRIIKVNIPFEFSVGDRDFPAGSYSLASSAPPLLDLRDAKGHTLVRLLTNSVETQTAPASPMLEFISDGGRYSLAEVWQENDFDWPAAATSRRRGRKSQNAMPTPKPSPPAIRARR